MIKDFFKKWSPSEGCPWMNNVSLFVITLLFGSVSSVSAYDWSGNAVDNVLYKNDGLDAGRSESDASKVVFLQHVGTGKWLKPGGNFGVAPALGDYATELWICKKSVTIIAGWNRTYYFVNTSLGSTEGSWLGYETTEAKNVTENGVYMDKAKDVSGIYIAWNFVDLGNGKYAISNRYPNGANTTQISAKPDDWYLWYNEKTGDIEMKEVANINCATSGVFNGDKRIGDPDVETLKKDPNLQWRIVTMQDIYDALDKTSSASMDEPFDLTFLIKDSGFDRCSYYNKADNTGYNGWQTTNFPTTDDAVTDKTGATGFKLGVTDLYSSILSNSTDGSRYGCTYADGKKADDATKNATAKKDGKYFCAQVRGVSGNHKISQNIKIVKSGWYRVSCQGFTTSTAETPSYLVATTGNSEWVRKDLNSINVFHGEGEAPTDNDLTAAGKMFYNKQYPNALYIHANAGETLNIGIQFADDETAWTAFDDFHLAYCGNDNPELVLDETKTNVDYITQANESYNGFKGAIMYLHRKLDANKWNTIVLPVSLTMGQCRDLFGNNTMIAKLESYSNGVMYFRSVEDGDNTSDDELVMEANVPYIINPTISIGTAGINEQGEAVNKTVTYNGKTITQDDGATQATPITEYCTAPYGSTFINNSVNQTHMQTQEDLVGGAKTDEMNGLTFHGTLVKTFETNATTGKTDYHLNLQGKYIVYDGAIYSVGHQIGLKGLRGYFSFDSSQAKLNTVTFEIDGVTDQESEVTDIDEIFGGSIAAKQNSNVYTLEGKLVSTKGVSDNLPKGVYIINGKKHIVK